MKLTTILAAVLLLTSLGSARAGGNVYDQFDKPAAAAPRNKQQRKAPALPREGSLAYHTLRIRIESAVMMTMPMVMQAVRDGAPPEAAASMFVTDEVLRVLYMEELLP